MVALHCSMLSKVSSTMDYRAPNVVLKFPKPMFTSPRICFSRSGEPFSGASRRRSHLPPAANSPNSEGSSTIRIYLPPGGVYCCLRGRSSCDNRSPSGVETTLVGQHTKLGFEVIMHTPKTPIRSNLPHGGGEETRDLQPHSHLCGCPRQSARCC